MIIRRCRSAHVTDAECLMREIVLLFVLAANSVMVTSAAYHLAISLLNEGLELG